MYTHTHILGERGKENDGGGRQNQLLCNTNGMREVGTMREKNKKKQFIPISGRTEVCATVEAETELGLAASRSSRWEAV